MLRDRLPLGWFLRAESFYGVATERDAVLDKAGSYHAMSHGESFLDVAREWFERPAFFVLDEPEAGLSFTSQLALIAAIGRGVAAGGQFLVATHSPVLMAVPGADIVVVGADGIERTAYEDLEVVAMWASFLEAPDRLLRHLADDT